MIKPRAIVFDADDTILQYCDGLREYINQYYDYGLVGLPTNYDLTGWLPATEVSKNRILERFNSSWQFGILKPLEGAKEVLEALVKYNSTSNDPIDLVVLTKCGKDPITTALRKANLTNAFGIVFHEVIIIDGHEDKKFYLSKLQKRYNLILSVDDYIGNVKGMMKLSIPVVLMERPHNIELLKKQNNIPSRNSWTEIFKDFIKPHLK